MLATVAGEEVVDLGLPGGYLEGGHGSLEADDGCRWLDLVAGRHSCLDLSNVRLYKN